MKKTLYITDLDGTFLNSKGELSHFSASTINALIKKGMIFSYATARSIVSAGKIVKDLCLNVPVIVHNGIFIMDPKTSNIDYGSYLNNDNAKSILKTLYSNKVYPFSHSIIDGEEKISYVIEYINSHTKDFVQERKNDKRLRKCSIDNMCDGDVFHFTCIDDETKLKRMYDMFKNDFQCIYYEDMYSKKMWLEILPKNITKGASILKLKELLNCDRVVCFGDGVNDINMFEVSDESYAVKNAKDEIKNIATGVIASCDDDGVARFLKEIFK